MSIIKHNNVRVDDVYINEKSLFLNGVKIKKNDILYYRCDVCGQTESYEYRSFNKFTEKKYINEKIFCSKCLRKQTNLQKYGVENLSQSKAIQEKIKQKSLEKYGTEHFLSSPEVRKKIDETNIKKYGNKYIFNIEEVREKARQTMIKKYGVSYSLESEELKNKFYKSMKERYGTRAAMHSFEIKEKRRKSIQSSVSEKIFSFKHIKPLFEKEDFIGINKFYKWKCNTCNKIFEDHLDYGHIPRCPHCFPKRIKINRKLHELQKWMSVVLGIGDIQVEDKNAAHPYTLGLYLPGKKLAFDFISLYWDSESQGNDKESQINKLAATASKDIELFMIFEDEWVEKQKIIKSIIKKKLGILNKNLNIEDCEVKEITNKDAKYFYNTNHLQGHVNSQFNYGLFHKSEGLVSCMSISHSRFNHNYTWEITRFANRTNINISNSLSLLLEAFRKSNNGSIITYSDCRYFDSFIYEVNGFDHINMTEPNYFYTNYSERYNRLHFQKNKLHNKLKYFDEEMTEWQNMQMNGWDRIWDCGSDVYVLE